MGWGREGGKEGGKEGEQKKDVRGKPLSGMLSCSKTI